MFKRAKQCVYVSDMCVCVCILVSTKLVFFTDVCTDFSIGIVDEIIGIPKGSANDTGFE